MLFWQPSADRATLLARADLINAIRAFFRERDVLEVTTPVVASAANSAPFIDSLAVFSRYSEQKYWLLTSPELPMKRLLAAGVGDCYQMCQAFRDGEQGSRHNPEFTLLEWYRIGFDIFMLIDEVIALVKMLGAELAVCKYTYAQAFQDYLDIDPFAISAKDLNQYVSNLGLWHGDASMLATDQALDLLLSEYIARQFPKDQLTVIYHYPASQAALARVLPGNPNLAERFEVYWGDLELANGFHELQDSKVQRQRFQQENRQRESLGKPVVALDEHFLAALEVGLPDCSGVALGVDRLLMKRLKKDRLESVLSFSWRWV